MLSPPVSDEWGVYETRWRELESGHWQFEKREHRHGGPWEPWQQLGESLSKELFEGYMGPDAADTPELPAALAARRPIG